MDIKYIIILHESVDVILERLNQRDGRGYSREFIEKFQSKEMERGIKVAKSLSRPYSVMNSSDINKVSELIESIVYSK